MVPRFVFLGRLCRIGGPGCWRSSQTLPGAAAEAGAAGGAPAERAMARPARLLQGQITGCKADEALSRCSRLSMVASMQSRPRSPASGAGGPATLVMPGRHLTETPPISTLPARSLALLARRRCSARAKGKSTALEAKREIWDRTRRAAAQYCTVPAKMVAHGSVQGTDGDASRRDSPPGPDADRATADGRGETSRDGGYGLS